MSTDIITGEWHINNISLRKNRIKQLLDNPEELKGKQLFESRGFLVGDMGFVMGLIPLGNAITIYAYSLEKKDVIVDDFSITLCGFNQPCSERVCFKYGKPQGFDFPLRFEDLKVEKHDYWRVKMSGKFYSSSSPPSS